MALVKGRGFALDGSLIVVLLVACAVGAMLFWLAKWSGASRAVVPWERTMGHIESLKFTIKRNTNGEEPPDFDWIPQIAYYYTVNGETYWGERVAPWDYSIRTAVEFPCPEADAFRRAFPPGQDRPIFYYPRHPERSYLFLQRPDDLLS